MYLSILMILVIFKSMNMESLPIKTDPELNAIYLRVNKLDVYYIWREGGRERKAMCYVPTVH